jgi:hypothetical protein
MKKKRQSGALKARAERCENHHPACDCYEYAYLATCEALVQRLKVAEKVLRFALRKMSEEECYGTHEVAAAIADITKKKL